MVDESGKLNVSYDVQGYIYNDKEVSFHWLCVKRKKIRGIIFLVSTTKRLDVF